MSKKIDWDFRFIMTVFTLTALFGIWICFQAYPAQSLQAARIAGWIVLIAAPIPAALIARRAFRQRAEERQPQPRA